MTKVLPKQYNAFSVHDTYFADTSNAHRQLETTGAPEDGHVSALDIRNSKWKELFSSPKIRTMIVEMHSIFNECHENIKMKGKLDNHESLYLSQKYRSVLRSVANINDPEDQYMQDATLWAIYECMFLKTGGLRFIFLIMFLIDMPIILDLINWAHECFTFCNILAKSASEEYEMGIKIEEGSYWKAVVVSLLCCRFDECTTFLRLLRNDSAALAFIQHLEKFDTEWLQDEGKLVLFNQWQETLSVMVSNKKFDSNRNIAFLARLLYGDEKILRHSAKNILTEWWQMMPFYVFVRYPTIAYNGLGPVADECRALFKESGVEDSNDLDPFYAVFNLGDISVLQDLVANPWLSLHLVDTMFCCESYEKPILKVRNNLLDTYGSALFVNCDLWEIAVSYLLECGVPGKLKIESLIDSTLIDDENTAEKLLKICIDHNLENSLTCVVSTMTNKHLRCEAWASALLWALRLGHGKGLDIAVNTIVWKASEKEISNMNVIEHISPNIILLSPSLSFLFNYYNYYRTLYSGNAKTASEILMGLIASPDVPSNFHSVLFGQLACVLKEESIPIARQTIYEIISFFKQYSMDHKTEDSLLVALKQLLLIRLREATA